LNHNTYTLHQLGWNDWFKNLAAELPGENMVPARINGKSHSNYSILAETGEHPASLEGKLLRGIQNGLSENPGVGDWVLATLLDDGSARIRHMLPRKSALYRNSSGRVTEKQVIVANLDYIFIVSGLDRDFNVRRLERYVTMGWESGAKPVIVLNKADLPGELELEGMKYAVEAVAPFVPVHLVSALSGSGVNDLEKYLDEGVTVALIGSSGCGKSTLVNSIAGIDLQETREVRQNDSRGRHTTVTRDILFPERGGILIDNPGLREIQLYADEESLDMTFSDIAELAVDCKFSDCTHQSEPGCNVRRAIEEGELDESRFESYLKLQKELEYHELRRSGKKDPKLKEISKFAKKLRKHGKNPGNW
jgi:ribosome biogenesis GTPase